MRRLPRRAALGPARTVRAHGHVHRVLDAGAARPAANMRRVQTADRKGAAAGKNMDTRACAYCVRARIVPVHVLYAAWGAWRVSPWDCRARLRLQPGRVALHVLRTYSARSARPTHRCYARRCRPESCSGWGWASQIARCSAFFCPPHLPPRQEGASVLRPSCVFTPIHLWSVVLVECQRRSKSAKGVLVRGLYVGKAVRGSRAP